MSLMSTPFDHILLSPEAHHSTFGVLAVRRRSTAQGIIENRVPGGQLLLMLFIQLITIEFSLLLILQILVGRQGPQ